MFGKIRPLLAWHKNKKVFPSDVTRFPRKVFVSIPLDFSPLSRSFGWPHNCQDVVLVNL